MDNETLNQFFLRLTDEQKNQEIVEIVFTDELKVILNGQNLSFWIEETFPYSLSRIFNPVKSNKNLIYRINNTDNLLLKPLLIKHFLKNNGFS